MSQKLIFLTSFLLMLSLVFANVAFCDVIEVRVAAGEDDSEEDVATGAIDLTSSDLEITEEGEPALNQLVGMRFANVAIPQGATITSAYVQFQVDETDVPGDNRPGTKFLRGEAVDDAASFTDAAFDISSRPTTAAEASWDWPEWLTEDEEGPDQQTSDISAVIQEIVDRSGWASGNALVLIITGSGENAAEAYDGEPEAAALLHVEFTAGDAPAVEGPTIAWVSYHAADDEPHADAAAVGFTQAPDIGYTDLLKAQGYNVVRVLTSQEPDVEFLNTMDLVIISRTASSGHYSGSGASLWNSITAPMINLNGYTLRSSRLGFTDGTDMPDTTGDIRLTVTDPAHPIFAGIALTDGTMDNLYAEGAVPLPTDGTISRGISINNNNLDEEGTVLATIAEVSADTGPVGGLVIAELPAGATMQNSSGSPEDVLGGPRLVFLTGSREPSGVTGGQAAALYDLYPDGEQMFLNAVAYMLQ